MTWLRLDDSFGEHPKIDVLSDGAYRLHVQAMNFSGRLLTNGRVPERRVERLMPKFKPGYVKELVKLGLWEPVEDDDPAGWDIHDFLDYNPSADDVRARRDARAAAGKKGGNRKAQALARATANGGHKKEPQVGLTPTPSRPVGARDGTSLTSVEPPPTLAAESGVGSEEPDPASVAEARAAAKAALRR